MLSLKAKDPMPRTRKPVSENQLAANRANAAQSTGPRSPEGKARSAQNSRKHAFTASAFPVVRIEDKDDVAHLREDAIAAYQPVNSQELFAVERIALAQQALLRVERLHSGLCTVCLNEVLSSQDRPFVGLSPYLVDQDNQILKVQNRSYLLGEGFHRVFKSSLTFTLFLRYQAQSERMYRRAVEEFDRLKALRHELPNEPILEAQPDATEPASASPQTNPPASVEPVHPPEHYGFDGELLFPYDRPDYPFQEPRDVPIPAPPECPPNSPADPPPPAPAPPSQPSSDEATAQGVQS
jgi:hypothetical protein